METLDAWIGLNLSYCASTKEAAAWLNRLTTNNKIIVIDQEQQMEKLVKMAIEHFENKTQLNGPETYRKIAEALPWEIQSTLLALRDCQDDPAATEELFYKMPTTVYIALQELCLAGPWYEEKRSGLALTSAGKHLAEYCTC